MDTPKSSKSASTAAKSAGAAAEAAVLDTMQRFNKMSADYSQAQQEATGSAYKGIEEAARAYADAIKGVNSDLLGRLEDVYRKFGVTVQGAQGKDDAQKRIEDAYRTLSDSVQEISKETQTRLEEAYQSYVGTVQERQLNGQKLHYEANRSYLTEMKNIWSSVDVDAVLEVLAKGAPIGG